MAECDSGANPFVARVFHDCLYKCARVLRFTVVVLSYSMLCSGFSWLTSCCATFSCAFSTLMAVFAQHTGCDRVLPRHVEVCGVGSPD